jgi:alpha-mannosidase
MIRLKDRKTTSADRIIPVLATQHFDIIWRKPLDYYRQKQRQVIDTVLDIIDKYPDFHFAFQQADVLRHYARRAPENFERFRKAVASGQIEIVGGLEAIPDSNIPGGESLVRNILYGRQWVARNLGVEPKVATMLDAFGSSGQLPQILSKMGYSSFLSGRMPGASFPGNGITSLFVWKGIDGSEIAGINCDYASIPEASLGAWYGWGILEGFDKEYQESSLSPEVFKNDIISGLKNFSRLAGKEKNVVAVISGEEHLPRFELPEALKEFSEETGCRAQSMRYDKFAEHADWSSVDRLEGEYNVEFSGCYTTRIELKQLSRMAEEKLYRDEFVRSAAAADGRDFDGLCDISDLWRKLSFCQFHDAICGCHIDENYFHIIEAFEEIIKKTDEDIDIMLAGCGNNKQTLSVLNVNPFDITDIVQCETGGAAVAKDGVHIPSQTDGSLTWFPAALPAGDTVSYEISSLPAQIPQQLSPVGIDTRIGRFRLRAVTGGAEVRDERTSQIIFGPDSLGGRLVLKNENGTLWTENYTDKSVAEKACSGKIVSIEAGEVFVKITLEGLFGPNEADWSSFKKLKWQKEVYVHRFIDRIDLEVELFYEGRDTEVCLEFDCGLDAADARAVYDIPFGSLAREPYGSYQYRFGRGNWPAYSRVDYCDRNKGICIVHFGTPGVLAKDGRVSYSLLRSGTDYNQPLFPAKPEPLSFNNGRNRFRFSLIPHKTDEEAWLSQARCCVVPPRAGKSEANFRMPAIRIDAPNVYLSCLKPAEDGRGIIARVYEVIGSNSEFSLTFDNAKFKIIETSMDESEDAGAVNGSSLRIKAYEIRTFRLLPV